MSINHGKKQWNSGLRPNQKYIIPIKSEILCTIGSNELKSRRPRSRSTTGTSVHINRSNQL